MSYFANEQIANCDARTTDDDWYDRKDYSRAGVFAGLESQRTACQLNSRPTVTTEAQAKVIALDFMIAFKAGHDDEARRLAVALKPWMYLLREG